MRKILFFVLLLFSSAFFTGCRHSQYIENQAYAVLMGVDRVNGGDWEITIRIPGIGSGSGGESGGSQGDSEYLSFSAAGTSFQDALTVLRTGVPRNLDLSALTVIVISEEIAQSEDMPYLLEILADERKIYGSTRLAVCKGDAGDFVGEQEAVIGNVLSEGLISRLENLEDNGYIPASQLDAVYFDTKSVYSDPLIMLCVVAEGNSDGAGDTSAEGLAVKAEGKNRYLGAAVMKDGMMIGNLDGIKTMYVNLIRGSVDGFSHTSGNITAQLAVSKKPKIKISTDGDAPEIDIEIKLLSLGVPDEPDLERLSEEIEDEISETIALLQHMGAEPFGFASMAAADFFTLDSWREIDWRNAFSRANVRVDVSIKPIDRS